MCVCVCVRVHVRSVRCVGRASCSIDSLALPDSLVSGGTLYPTGVVPTVEPLRTLCRFTIPRRAVHCCLAVLLTSFQDKKLDNSLTLRQAGIPAEGEIVLRLDVTGGGGSGGGEGGGGASGPPITIKVRVEGGKTFIVSTTTVSCC